VISLRTQIFVLLICTLAMTATHGKERNLIAEPRIKKLIIEESIAAYPGNCPCPYNVTRNGSSCGGRSAWSRRGGYAPVCYEREVTPEMVKNYRGPGGPTAGELTMQTEFITGASGVRPKAQGGTIRESRTPTCYTGPRGGTYTITSSGRKNYSGC
jgi:hypothetical protein